MKVSFLFPLHLGIPEKGYSVFVLCVPASLRFYVSLYLRFTMVWGRKKVNVQISSIPTASLCSLLLSRPTGIY